MRILHIPPELIHKILGHLLGEAQALDLVCKAWVHPSRCHLFAKVTLNDTLLKRFLAFGDRSFVIPYIRHLHFERWIGRIDLWDDYIPDLVGFQRVRSLTLEALSPHLLSRQARSAIFTQFTGIVRFFLVGPTKINESQLADTICSFPRLEVLALACVDLEWSTPTSREHALSPQTISRHLHTLSIIDDHNHAIKLLAWISSFENLPALRSLYLMWSGGFKALNDILPDLPSLERLSVSKALALGRNGVSLSYLKSDLLQSVMLALTVFVDLSHQHRLRSLHVRQLLSWETTKCVTQTLASITSVCMDELIFDVSQGQDAEKDIEWSEVDGVLQSPQFSKLRTVQLNVIIRPPFVDPQLLASFPVRLSQCHDRGILSVRTTVTTSDLESQLLPM
jgi:hypothetical protein